MRIRKTLSSRLATKYLLIVRNEENFAEKTSVSFTYSRLALLATTIFVVILLISLFLVRTLLNQWFNPRHVQLEANKKLVEMSIKIDSLELEMQKKDRFILNFQKIVMGDSITFDYNSADEEKEAQINRADFSEEDLAEIDSQFREEFESSGVNLATFSNASSDLQEIFFYSPITGFVSGKYNVLESHYGVDVVANKNEPVKCVADGTVIFASWTQDFGHVIAVQHRGNLISFYKHNAEILKKVGTFVSGGEIISIIGNTGELTDGSHLHFELWNNGSPVNPEDFVSF